MSAGYFRSCTSERPAALLSSLASIVPSLSGSAALKRFSTSARNSFLSRVPSLSGSAAAKSFALSRPRNSSVESAIVIAVELVEQLRSCTLRFGEIDRAVIICVDCFDQALRPRWRGADQRNGEGNQNGFASDAHAHVL